MIETRDINNACDGLESSVCFGRHIASGALSRLLLQRRPYVIIDRAVFRLYPFFDDMLEPAKTLIIPGGERSKTFRSLQRIWNWLADVGADRSSCILAVGGGSVLDIAGFAASTWMRGIRHIVVPTTLLALVDAAVGGKTALNLPQGKNMVGAFHQPEKFIGDTAFTATQSVRELRSGFGEILKTAIIGDPEIISLISRLKTRSESIYSGIRATVVNQDDFPSSLEEIAKRCISFKSRIVCMDAEEKGIRRVLNYGHTLGHALETSMGYRGITHGEAVAYGMDFAAWLGKRLGYSCDTVLEMQRNAAKLVALPPYGRKIRLPAPEKIGLATHHDKKASGNRVEFVFVPEPGKYMFKPVEIKDLNMYICEYFKVH